MLGSSRPGYHPKLALIAFVLLVLIVLIAGFAMLSATPAGYPEAGFPHPHWTKQMSGHSSHSAAGDAFKRSL